MGHPSFRRFLGAFLAPVYLFTNCVFAHVSETNFWAERKERVAPAKAGAQVFPLGKRLDSGFRRNDDITRYGSIRKILNPQSSSSKSQTIIHIQDVHMNSEAQRNISGAIRALAAKGETPLIALEGAFGPADIGLLQNFPDPQIVRSVADSLLNENKITGAFHAALLTRSTVVGVDDLTHHRANVQAYRDAAPLLVEEKKKWAKQRDGNAQRKLSVLNAALSAFDATVEAYRSGKMGMGDYLRALPGTPASQVKNFLEAYAIEQSLDFARVESERARMLEKLASRLSQSDADALMTVSLSFRAGEQSNADFYSFLENLCRKNAVDFGAFPAMTQYLRYALLSDRIDSEALFAEMRAMEHSAFAALAKRDEERALVDEARWIYLTGKLLDFSLTRDEWQEYKKEAKNTSFERFYREAEVRDQKMADNFLRVAKKQWPVAILVTGGFHSSGIDQRLVDAGFTVVQFVPRISKVESKSDSAYLSVFSQQKTPLERVFDGDKLFLSPEQATLGHIRSVAVPVAALAFLKDISVSYSETMLSKFWGASSVAFRKTGAFSARVAVGAAHFLVAFPDDPSSGRPIDVTLTLGFTTRIAQKIVGARYAVFVAKYLLSWWIELPVSLLISFFVWLHDNSGPDGDDKWFLRTRSSFFMAAPFWVYVGYCLAGEFDFSLSLMAGTLIWNMVLHLFHNIVYKGAPLALGANENDASSLPLYILSKLPPTNEIPVLTVDEASENLPKGRQSLAIVINSENREKGIASADNVLLPLGIMLVPLKGDSKEKEIEEIKKLLEHKGYEFELASWKGDWLIAQKWQIDPTERPKLDYQVDTKRLEDLMEYSSYKGRKPKAWRTRPYSQEEKRELFLGTMASNVPDNLLLQLLRQLILVHNTAYECDLGAARDVMAKYADDLSLEHKRELTMEEERVLFQALHARNATPEFRKRLEEFLAFMNSGLIYSRIHSSLPQHDREDMAQEIFMHAFLGYRFGEAKNMRQDLSVTNDYEFWRGNKFSTHAMWRVRAGVTRYLRNRNYVREWITFSEISIDGDAFEGDASVEPLDAEDVSLTEKVEELQARQSVLKKTLGYLPRIEQLVLKMRYGIGTGFQSVKGREIPYIPGWEVIGEILGVSHEQVRKLEARARRRLEGHPRLRKQFQPSPYYHDNRDVFAVLVMKERPPVEAEEHTPDHPFEQLLRENTRKFLETIEFFDSRSMNLTATPTYWFSKHVLGIADRRAVQLWVAPWFELITGLVLIPYLFVRLHDNKTWGQFWARLFGHALLLAAIALPFVWGHEWPIVLIAALANMAIHFGWNLALPNAALSLGESPKGEFARTNDSVTAFIHHFNEAASELIWEFWSNSKLSGEARMSHVADVTEDGQTYISRTPSGIGYGEEMFQKTIEKRTFGGLVHTFPEKTLYVKISPDGKWMVSNRHVKGGSSQSLIAVDGTRHTVVFDNFLTDHSLSFSPNSRFLIVDPPNNSYGYALGVYDLNHIERKTHLSITHLKPILELPHPHPHSRFVTESLFSKDCQRLVVIWVEPKSKSHQNLAEVFNFREGIFVSIDKPFVVESNRSWVLSPDGKYLATHSRPFVTIYLLDHSDKGRIHGVPLQSVESLRFDRSSRFIVIQGRDQEDKVFELSPNSVHEVKIPSLKFPQKISIADALILDAVREKDGYSYQLDPEGKKLFIKHHSIPSIEPEYAVYALVPELAPFVSSGSPTPGEKESRVVPDAQKIPEEIFNSLSEKVRGVVGRGPVLAPFVRILLDPHAYQLLIENAFSPLAKYRNVFPSEDPLATIGRLDLSAGLEALVKDRFPELTDNERDELLQKIKFEGGNGLGGMTRSQKILTFVNKVLRNHKLSLGEVEAAHRLIYENSNLEPKNFPLEQWGTAPPELDKEIADANWPSEAAGIKELVIDELSLLGIRPRMLPARGPLPAEIQSALSEWLKTIVGNKVSAVSNEVEVWTNELDPDNATLFTFNDKPNVVYLAGPSRVHEGLMLFYRLSAPTDEDPEPTDLLRDMFAQFEQKHPDDFPVVFPPRFRVVEMALRPTKGGPYDWREHKGTLKSDGLLNAAIAVRGEDYPWYYPKGFPEPSTWPKGSVLRIEWAREKKPTETPAAPAEKRIAEIPALPLGPLTLQSPFQDYLLQLPKEVGNKVREFSETWERKLQIKFRNVGDWINEFGFWSQARFDIREFSEIQTLLLRNGLTLFCNVRYLSLTQESPATDLLKHFVFYSDLHGTWPGEDTEERLIRKFWESLGIVTIGDLLSHRRQEIEKMNFGLSWVEGPGWAKAQLERLMRPLEAVMAYYKWHFADEAPAHEGVDMTLPFTHRFAKAILGKHYTPRRAQLWVAPWFELITGLVLIPYLFVRLHDNKTWGQFWARLFGHALLLAATALPFVWGHEWPVVLIAALLNMTVHHGWNRFFPQFALTLGSPDENELRRLGLSHVQVEFLLLCARETDFSPDLLDEIRSLSHRETLLQTQHWIQNEKVSINKTVPVSARRKQHLNFKLGRAFLVMDRLLKLPVAADLRDVRFLAATGAENQKKLISYWIGHFESGRPLSLVEAQAVSGATTLYRTRLMLNSIFNYAQGLTESTGRTPRLEEAFQELNRLKNEDAPLDLGDLEILSSLDGSEPQNHFLGRWADKVINKNQNIGVADFQRIFGFSTELRAVRAMREMRSALDRKTAGHQLTPELKNARQILIAHAAQRPNVTLKDVVGSDMPEPVWGYVRSWAKGEMERLGSGISAVREWAVWKKLRKREAAVQIRDAVFHFVGQNGKIGKDILRSLQELEGHIKDPRKNPLRRNMRWSFLQSFMGLAPLALFTGFFLFKIDFVGMLFVFLIVTGAITIYGKDGTLRFRKKFPSRYAAVAKAAPFPVRRIDRLSELRKFLVSVGVGQIPRIEWSQTEGAISVVMVRMDRSIGQLLTFVQSGPNRYFLVATAEGFVTASDIFRTKHTMAFAAPMEGDPGFVQQTITLLLMSGRFTEWYSDTKPLSLKAERAYELLRLIPELIVSETASGAILVRKRGPSNPSFVFPELLKKILEEGPALDLRISSIDGRAVPAPRLLKHIVLRVEDDENFRRAVGIARAFPSAESVTFLVRRGAPRARYEAYLVKAGLVGPRFLVHERRETWLFNGNVLDPEKLQESLPLSLRWNFHKMIFISFEDLVIPDRYATHSYLNSLTLLVLDAANSGVMVTVLEKIESERKTRMLAARQA